MISMDLLIVWCLVSVGVAFCWAAVAGWGKRRGRVDRERHEAMVHRPAGKRIGRL